MENPRCIPGWITAWLAVSSIVVIYDALFVILRPHTLPGGKWNYIYKPYNIYLEVDSRYKNVKDGFVLGVGWMNLVEVVFNIIALLLNARGKAVSVVVALVALSMTFGKTLLYFLLSCDLGHGENQIMHNDWMLVFFLFVIPNGIWVILPFLSIVGLGYQILDHQEQDQRSTKKQKSN